MSTLRAMQAVNTRLQHTTTGSRRSVLVRPLGARAQPSGALVAPCPRPEQAAASQVVCHAASGSDDSHAGHAVLHDFCMTLPYGAIALAGGVVSFFLARSLAAPLAGVGAITLLCSVMSLKQWRAAGSSAPFTLLSAAASGAAAYVCFPLMGGGAVGLLAGALTVLSAASCLFCLYNVVAGGNPPKKGTPTTPPLRA